MKSSGLSYNSRKVLIVNIGDTAAIEIAELVAQMAAEIEKLRHIKVNITRIVFGISDPSHTIAEESV
ncbi:MAG: hypothetical protein CBD74_07250 [Saprospirales bacterium TMED214]|nr:MAG: hypothetical protein CBD74_07250 [Saprospirales bacterium TMED214]